MKPGENDTVNIHRDFQVKHKIVETRTCVDGR